MPQEIVPALATHERSVAFTAGSSTARLLSSAALSARLLATMARSASAELTVTRASMSANVIATGLASW